MSNSLKNTLTNKILVSLGVCTGLFSGAALAEDEERGFLAEALMSDETAKETGIDVRGFISGGFTGNLTNSAGFNGGTTFNDRANKGQMDQLYFIAERKASSDSLSLGGRVDALYGADAAFTQSIGFDDDLTADRTSDIYKMAIPQAYLELQTGLGDGLSIKAGHFYTLIGYETVPAADNFFYSHAYSMQYAEPFTHWGALASYPISDKVTVTAGAVNGWDNLSDSSDGNLAFLGSVGITPYEDTSFTFSLITGNEGIGTNQTTYSMVLVQGLTDSLNLVLQHDLGYREGATAGENNLSWYSANSYLIYNLTEMIDVGARLEWFKDSDGYRVVGLRSGAGGVPADYYAASLGANIKPTSYVILRPEVRFDYQDVDSSEANIFDNGKDDTQLLVAMNGILKF